MFKFLKDMLGLPRPVEITGYQDGEVIFKSETPLDIGLVHVLAKIEGVQVRGQVQVVESGLEECKGLWIAPEEVLPLLREVFSPGEKRAQQRFPRSLRVRSPKLESFQGNTLDLSESGMRLVGKGDFALDDVITLTFDLDDARQTEIDTRAKVCWIGPSAKDGWHAMGLQFLDLGAATQVEAFSYYRDFLKRISVQDDSFHDA